MKGEPGTLKFTVSSAPLHGQHFCCSLGKNLRCDPADTYLKHCIVTGGTAERNRIFPPLWCTAADPEKSQLLQAILVQSANASFLQSFAVLNSLNNPLNGCSSYTRVAVLAQTPSLASCLLHWPEADVQARVRIGQQGVSFNYSTNSWLFSEAFLVLMWFVYLVMSKAIVLGTPCTCVSFLLPTCHLAKSITNCFLSREQLTPFVCCKHGFY